LVLATALACAGCGSATDGAALVHGALFAGRPPWQTSLELTGKAAVHGAGPFRVIVTRPGDSGTGRDGLPAGLTIEITAPRLPEGGQALAVGGEEGPQARVDLVPESSASPTTFADGADVRYSDGGFTVHAVGGRLQVQYDDGSAPGDGARGSFELVFQTGERVTGTFAAALAD
jgi:hypothetical protein